MAMLALVVYLVSACAFGYTLPEDPGTWTQMSPSSHPSARQSHAMAYLGDDKVLLFGGCTQDIFDDLDGWTPLPAETWIYDLSNDTWTLMNPASQPSARAYHGMARVDDGVVVLYGGVSEASEEGTHSDTWVYDLDSNTWTEMTPSSIPGMTVFFAMSYAGDDQAIVLSSSESDDEGLVWSYDLSENGWADVTPSPAGDSPDHRVYSDMAYLGEPFDSSWVLLFGGQDDPQTPSETFSDTWAYRVSQAQWETGTFNPSPSARAKHALASLLKDYVLLFGGQDVGGSVNRETWIFDGDEGEWIEQATATSPPARSRAGMAKIGNGLALLFGGANGSTNFDDTWVFDAGLPGITVTPVDGLVTTENGGKAMFIISAQTPPTDDVIVPLTSSDLTEGTVPASVTLPAGSTNGVLVTVTGVNDAFVDGDIAYTIITGDPTSGGEFYDSFDEEDVSDVSVTNWDMDVPRIEVEGGGDVIANGDSTPSTNDNTNFGPVAIDDSTSETFTIRNVGGVDLWLDGDPVITLDGSDDFSVSSQPGQTLLDPDDAVEFAIRCRPSDEGARTAVVSISSNDPDDDPFEFTVRCTGGLAPEIRVLGSGSEIPYQDTDPSTTKNTVFSALGDTAVTKTFTIQNQGNAELLLHNGPNYVTVDHAQFAVTRQPEVAIDEGEATSFDLTFTPSTDDFVIATVSIWNSDDDQTPFTFEVHGSVGGSSEPRLRADAGPDQTLLVGSTVTLEGLASYSGITTPVTGPFDYSWEFTVLRYEANSPVLMIPAGSRCRETVQGFDTASGSFIADLTGTYTLTLDVTDGEGETATDQVTITVVNDFSEVPDFRLERITYGPNPFSSIVTFGFDGEGVADLIMISIFDLRGRLVWSRSAVNTTYVQWDGQASDGDDVANGAYIAIIAIRGNGLIRTQRVLVMLRR